MSVPSLSVLMTVYNGMPWLPQAVDSILAQTYDDFEFIIVNDGSTDGTAAYLNQRLDARVRVIHQENGGTAVASNAGLELCRGEFLARMDADDIAMPDRFAKQIRFLREHPDVGLVGSNIIPLGQQKAGSVIRLATDHEEIYQQLLLGQHAMCHPTVMMRTELLKGLGGYWKLQGMFDAWDMFLRMGEVASLANIAEPLLNYRIHTGSINGRQMRRLRLSIDYACYLAHCRKNGQSPLSLDAFEKARPVTARWSGNLDVYSLLQYRLGLADLLGDRPLRGYCRIVWSAICAPQRTINRLRREWNLRLERTTTA